MEGKVCAMIREAEQPLFWHACYDLSRKSPPTMVAHGRSRKSSISQTKRLTCFIAAGAYLAKSLKSMIKPDRCRQRPGACRLRSPGTVQIHPTITIPCDRSMGIDSVQLKRQRKSLFSNAYRLAPASSSHCFGFWATAERWWRASCGKKRDKRERKNVCVRVEEWVGVFWSDITQLNISRCLTSYPSGADVVKCTQIKSLCLHSKPPFHLLHKTSSFVR